VELLRKIMNVSKILSGLRFERQLLEKAIAGLECIARDQARRPGGLSKWIAKSESAAPPVNALLAGTAKYR
jgi:hypothetical protein